MCDPPGYCTTSPSIRHAVANAVGERLGAREFIISETLLDSLAGEWGVRTCAIKNPIFGGRRALGVMTPEFLVFLMSTDVPFAVSWSVETSPAVSTDVRSFQVERLEKEWVSTRVLRPRADRSIGHRCLLKDIICVFLRSAQWLRACPPAKSPGARVVRYEERP